MNFFIYFFFLITLTFVSVLADESPKYGGYHKISTDDEDLKKAIKEVSGDFESKLLAGQAVSLKVLQVNSASAQVVNGMNYKVNLTLEKGNCPPLRFCSSSEQFICSVGISVSPSKDSYKITDFDCKQK